MRYKDKLILEDGDTIQRLLPTSFGKHLGQEEKDLYEIRNKEGIVTSEVIVIEHTNTKKPFNTTIHIMQRHIEKGVVVDEIIRN